MEQQVLELVYSLGKPDQEQEVLKLLCRCACDRLDGLLADGVAPGDCGERYPLAAAWMVLDWLEQTQGEGDIVALAAGDLSVRRGQREEGRLSHRALELLSPYLRDEGFVFRRVRG